MWISTKFKKNILFKTQFFLRPVNFLWKSVGRCGHRGGVIEIGIEWVWVEMGIDWMWVEMGIEWVWVEIGIEWVWDEMGIDWVWVEMVIDLV